MCGRFALVNPTPNFGPADISALQNLPSQYNIAPGQSIHLLIQNNNQKIQLVSKPWGIKMKFSNSPSEKLVINARSETVGQKPMFSRFYANKRCVIVATGFYEWDKQHNPYYFFDTHSKVLGFAGIYNKEAVILTKPASESFRVIHHRMPVIIDPSSIENWLSSTTSLERLSNILKNTPTILQHHPVPTLVNSPSNNTSMCIEPITDQLFT